MERIGFSYETAHYNNEFSDDYEDIRRKKRKKKFREKIFRAYGDACVVCGFDLRITNKLTPVGLEAAHIKWHQNGGPDTEDNGLVLCANHHRLFDDGVFTLSRKYRIIPSESIHGTNRSKKIISDHCGLKIRLPKNTSHFPHASYIDWHRDRIFNP